MEDQMQTSRFERKYIITEAMANIIREYVRGYMVLDEFSVGKPDSNYPVHSLYLDSDHLATYWATVQTEKTRFKLRIRYYDDQPNSPVFFEIKRRVDQCIFKQRGAVHRWAAPALVAGQFPEPSHLISSKPQHLVALQNFCRLTQLLHASPKMHVAYEREAWLSPGNNSLRITFDKYVRGEQRLEPMFVTTMNNPVSPFVGRCILEVKYTNRFPRWLSEMVCNLSLVQTGASKYCGSISNVANNCLGAFQPQVANWTQSELLKFF